MMSFESVRPYVQMASGLSELAQARAMEAAQGLLSLPATGIATGTKVASHAIDLADVMLATVAANRSNLTGLVRREMEVAISTVGLVPAQRLEEVQAEAARLRRENAQLRRGTMQAGAERPARKAAAPRRSAKKVPAKTKTKVQSAKNVGPVRTARSAVTTRANPAGE
jgi:hypothetical protein